MKKRKFLLILTVFLYLTSQPVPIAAAEESESFIAESVILAERDSGKVLYESNADEQRSPDTMVKIMTILLASEAIESGEVFRSEYVTASESAFFDITSDSETRGIAVGESMTFIDLMYCAIVGSANEACNIIAERISGSVDDFIALMNSRARALGCKNTVFVNTHGQRDARQYTTARDLYIIAAAAAKNPVFAEIAGAVSYTASATNLSAARSMTNSNHMLNESHTRSNLYYYKYAIFGKVSATYESGYGCLEYAERNGMALVAVLLGSSAITTEDGTVMQNLTETKRLLEWGYDNFSWRTVIATTQLVDNVPVSFGDGADHVNLRISEDVVLLVRNDLNESAVTYEVRLYESANGESPLTAPIEAGMELGELDVLVEGRLSATVSLVADASVGLRRVSLLQQQIKAALSSAWFKIIIVATALLFVAYAIIVIRYNVIRARRVRQIQAKKQSLAEQRRRHDDDI